MLQKMKKRRRYFRQLSLLLFLVLVCLSLFVSCKKEPTGEDVIEDDSNSSFSFIYMSDIQADPEKGNYTAFGDILDLALSHESNPVLLILGGDNVNKGSSKEEWELFHGAAGNRLDNLIVASVVGNHDNNELIKEQFNYPSKDDNFSYSFTNDNTLFLMLDSNIMGAGKEADVNWLKEELSNNSSRWRIAVCHHPFHTISNIPKDIERSETMRKVFLPVLEDSGVDLILCGHQHVYARTSPMIGSTINDSGIVQLMAASGGKESYTPSDKEYIEITVEAPNYLIVEITDSIMKVSAYNSKGEVIDSIEIKNR